MLGHAGPPTSLYKEHLITGEPLERCPVRTIQLAEQERPALGAELERYIRTYYPAYEDGHLLVSGGIGDQPARYLALINAIRDMNAESDAKDAAIEQANKTE
jgi:hypothetical protein